MNEPYEDKGVNPWLVTGGALGTAGVGIGMFVLSRGRKKSAIQPKATNKSQTPTQSQDPEQVERIRKNLFDPHSSQTKENAEQVKNKTGQEPSKNKQETTVKQEESQPSPKELKQQKEQQRKMEELKTQEDAKRRAKQETEEKARLEREKQERVNQLREAGSNQYNSPIGPQEKSTPPKKVDSDKALREEAKERKKESSQKEYLSPKKPSKPSSSDKNARPNNEDHLKQFKNFTKSVKDGTHSPYDDLPFYHEVPRRGSGIYADSMPMPDEGLQNQIYTHGVAALGASKYAKDGVVGNAEKVMDNIGSVQLSATDRNLHMGDMGVYMSGKVHAVGKSDIDTFKRGNRRVVPDDWVEESPDNFIFTKKEYDENLKKLQGGDANRKTDYPEAVVTPEKIHGVWVKDSVSSDYMSNAQAFSDKYSLPLHVIPNSSRNVDTSFLGQGKPRATSEEAALAELQKQRNR